jgi:hypothetical protein
MYVDTRGAVMKRKKPFPVTVCDNLCRAEAIREETFLKAALFGPRV